MKTKFSKLFVTILIVAAVTCCGALGVFAADDANADTAAATTASETVNTDNDHNSSLSIGLVAAALATGLAGIGGGMAVASAAPAAIAANSENEKTFGKSLIFVALGESIALYGLVISIMVTGSDFCCLLGRAIPLRYRGDLLPHFRNKLLLPGRPHPRRAHQC